MYLSYRYMYVYSKPCQIQCHKLPVHTRPFPLFAEQVSKIFLFYGILKLTIPRANSCAVRPHCPQKPQKRMNPRSVHCRSSRDDCIPWFMLLNFISHFPFLLLLNFTQFSLFFFFPFQSRFGLWYFGLGWNLNNSTQLESSGNFCLWLWLSE